MKDLAVLVLALAWLSAPACTKFLTPVDGGSGGAAGGSAGDAGGDVGGSGGSAGAGGSDSGSGGPVDSGPAMDGPHDVAVTSSDAADTGAPRCGNGILDPGEVCDGADAGATQIGSCNPECTGYYQKKLLQLSSNAYSGDLGGIAGADAKCVAEIASGWKALLVGGSRRATVTPFAGDGQLDWVIQKYTHYYNSANQLVWRTDDVALLGIRGGARQDFAAPAYSATVDVWGGYLPTNWTAGGLDCAGWTSTDPSLEGAYFLDGGYLMLEMAQFNCGSMKKILCVQQ